MRQPLGILAACLLGVTGASPAAAEDGIKVDLQFAGSITGSTVFDDPTGSYHVTGSCFVATVLTGDGLTVAYGGAAQATGPGTVATWVTCTVRNAVGQSASCTHAGACAGVAGPWAVSPVGVCVSAFAVFGPNPVRIVTLPETCDSILA